MSDTDSAVALNIPLARKVLEHLIAHPDEHDQDHFGNQTACGTTLCIAGTTLWMSPEAEYRWDDMGHMVEPGGEKCSDEPGSLERQAGELLGLDHVDAMELFYTMDNQTALARLAEHIETAEAAAK